MSPLIQPAATESHAVEAKGPHSFWVHRFVDDPGGAGRRYSRVVYFSRTRADAESYVQAVEGTPPGH
ncbi:hypothetical protein [Motiliproteus sp. SC1-56]|uniref:hypothetical protein n=1 Tax=Motiliproteus sp. SC1-56 TaxID=2799565 RepID=UPI001A8EC7F6|nr:hypothetical protein [Motiliproteus sp. SC1-56]